MKPTASKTSGPPVDRTRRPFMYSDGGSRARFVCVCYEPRGVLGVGVFGPPRVGFQKRGGCCEFV